MPKKSRALEIGVFFSEIFLLVLYARRTRTFLSPAEFLRSFSWAPVSGPFAIAPFIGIGATRLASGLVFLSWMTLAATMGFCFLERFQYPDKSLAKRILISLGLGLGVLSLAIFALGLTHLLYPASALIVGLAGTAYCLWEINRSSIQIEIPRSIGALFPVEGAVAWILLLLCGVMGAFHLLGAFLPPSSFDEMDYQLALPRLYTLNHYLINAPFNHLSYLPKNMSMLFTLGLLSGSSTIGKLFSLAFGVMAAAGIYFFGRERLGRRAAFLGMALFFLIPVVGNQMRNAVADLGTGFYELLGVFLLLEWVEFSQNSRLFLSAIFWGLALGSKYTALPGFAACLIVLGLKSGRAKTWEPLAIFLATALALFLPTLLWNFYQTGNPLAPILSSVIRSRNFFFEGKYIPLVDYALGRGIPDYFPIRRPQDVWLLPWRIFFRHNDYNHDLGGALLIAFPFAFLSLRKKLSPWLQNLALIAGLYWLFWVMTPIHISRYFVAGLALTSVLMGWMVSNGLGNGAWKWLLFTPLFLALFQQSLRMIAIQNVHKKPWGYLAGRTSRSDYLDAVLTDTPYDAENFANHHIPPNATILFFDEFRTFYLKRNFIAATPWDHELWHELVHESRNGADLAGRLHSLGITHFIANDNYLSGHSGFSWADPWTPPERLRAARFIKARMKRLYTSPTEVWLARIK